MTLMKRLLTLAGIATLMLTSVSAMAESSPVLDKVLKAGEIRVGMSGTQPPFSAHSRNGGLIGMDVDLARQLAGAMGVKLKIVEKPFGDLLAALDKGDVDIVMSGVSITAKRTTKFAFAGPYTMSGKSILTKSGLLAGARDSDSLNSDKHSYAALANSTSQEFVEKHLSEAKLVKIRDYDEGVKMVVDGEVDALVADMPICVLSVMRYPDAGLATLDRPMTVEPIGIAVPASDPQLVNLLDNYLDALEGTGYMTELRKAWLQDGSWVAALP